MFHKNRRWCVGDVESIEDLAEKLTNHVWCTCCGFRLAEYLFLNDSTGPDGAAEFAVVKLQGETYMQVESITFGWCNLLKAMTLIEECICGTFDNSEFSHPVQATIETAEQHGRCHACA